MVDEVVDHRLARILEVVAVANLIHLVDLEGEAVDEVGVENAVFLLHRYRLLHEKCRIQVLSVIYLGISRQI